MNITLSVDERVVEQARKAAQAMGKSLNQAVRDYLEELAGTSQRDAVAAELRELSMKGKAPPEYYAATTRKPGTDPDIARRCSPKICCTAAPSQA